MGHSVVSDVELLYLSLDQSLAANFTSARAETRGYDMGAIQIWWAGVDVYTGSFVVEFSLDGTHWADAMALTDAPTVCNANGGTYMEFPNVTCNFWRVRYVWSTITTGTCNIVSQTKRRR